MPILKETFEVGISAAAKLLTETADDFSQAAKRLRRDIRNCTARDIMEIAMCEEKARLLYDQAALILKLKSS